MQYTLSEEEYKELVNAKQNAKSEIFCLKHAVQGKETLIEFFHEAFVKATGGEPIWGEKGIEYYAIDNIYYDINTKRAVKKVLPTTHEVVRI